MTPWNIAGMAKVKGLDVIALTDHNAALNVPEAAKAGEYYGVRVIPGLEVTTREEAHVLAYFADVPAALAFGRELYAHLPDIQNKSALFGNQIVIGDNDEPAGTENKLLISATDLTLDALCVLAERYGGVCVPAHINRGANGLLGALGLMPPLPAFPAVEAVTGLACPDEATARRLVLRSSDAHRLGDIAERGFALDVPEATTEAVLALLRKGMKG